MQNDTASSPIGTTDSKGRSIVSIHRYRRLLVHPFAFVLLAFAWFSNDLVSSLSGLWGIACAVDPPLKRWAIIGCPTKTKNMLSDWSFGQEHSDIIENPCPTTFLYPFVQNVEVIGLLQIIVENVRFLGRRSLACHEEHAKRRGGA